MSMIPVTPRSLENELVVTFRLNNGLCHSCGTRIFDITTDTVTNNRYMVPLTKDGVVTQGRCLYCHPDNSRSETKRKRSNSLVNDDNTGVCFVSPDGKNKIIRLSPMERSAVMKVNRNSDESSCCTQSDDDEPPRNKNMKRKQALSFRKQAPERSGSRKSKMFKEVSDQSNECIPMPFVRKFMFDDDTKQSGKALSKEIGGKATDAVADEVGSYDDFDHNTRKKKSDYAKKSLTSDKKNLKGNKTTKSKVAASVSDDVPDVVKSSVYDDSKAELLADTDAVISKISSTSKKFIQLRDSDGDVYKGMILEGNSTKGIAHVKCTENRLKNTKVTGKTSVYKGEFENGYFEGEGYHLDVTGCLFHGQFHKGASHGTGTCKWPTGWEYNGEWKNDLREGHGTSRQVTSGGEVYSGNWMNDQWHGHGELQYAGGDVYTGAFYEGNIQGHGEYKFSDGSVYVGAFEHDVRCGYGEMIYNDKSRYTGEWKNNWREGNGTLTGVDGTIYEGSYVADEQVDGVLINPDGTKHLIRNGQIIM